MNSHGASSLRFTMILIDRGLINRICLLWRAMRKNPRLVLLGKRIREIRLAKQFSQEGFALAIDLDRTYYAGIERGERNVAALNLIKIAQGLDVEVGELFPFVADYS